MRQCKHFMENSSIKQRMKTVWKQIRVSSIGLAHMGDAVFEILVRTWLCAHGKATGKGLHQATIRLVCAESQAQKAEKKSEKKPEETVSETIGIEDFAKVDLRVGQIKECEKAENSDKLLVLQIDMGKEVRQVVSGIAKYYTPDELIGKKVVVVSNLKSVKLRGIESNGMILAADTENGVKVLFADENAAPGSKVR